MNNKILIIFTLIVITFLISGATGCKDIKLPWQKAREEITAGRGITAQFRTGEPPLDGIYASTEENFMVAIDIFNYMQTAIEVEACISDTPSKLFGGIPSECSKKSEPDPVPAAEKIDSKFYPGRAIMEFGEFSYQNIEKGMTTNIIVNLDATYKLRLTPQICIKRSTVEVAGVDCEDTAVLSGSMLGEDAATAPITITKIEKQVWPVGGNIFNVHLRMFFDNLGTGKLYTGDTKTRQILDTPTIKLIDGGEFTCAPDKIYLEEGIEKTIVCDLKVTLDDDESVRTSPLLIDFKYKYRIIASTGEIPIIVPKTLSKSGEEIFGQKEELVNPEYQF